MSYDYISMQRWPSFSSTVKIVSSITNCLLFVAIALSIRDMSKYVASAIRETISWWINLRWGWAQVYLGELSSVWRRESIKFLLEFVRHTNLSLESLMVSELSVVSNYHDFMSHSSQFLELFCVWREGSRPLLRQLVTHVFYECIWS